MTQEEQQLPILAEEGNGTVVDEYIPLNGLSTPPLEDIRTHILELLEITPSRNKMVRLDRLAARMSIEPIQILETLDRFLRGHDKEKQAVCLKALARISGGPTTLHNFRTLKQASKKLGTGGPFMRIELAAKAGVTPTRISKSMRTFGRDSGKHFGVR